MRPSNFRLAMLAGALAMPAVAQVSAPTLPPPAPLTELVKGVDIPFEQFTLPNGLRVIVHTDRKAPIVAVSVWYHIGSRDEPAGKTGFAHLFEHLMFYGSENNDGVFFKKLEDVGATESNGTTWFDRTNYFENVPTSALDLALYLESDRMGHLLGAVTQAKLDAQRGVVQNEKREGDNQPLGLAEYTVLENLFPVGHPYRHSTIGSMADLDAASLDDVRGWFRDHYGPNNAVLVLAGDIDVATAREKVTRYFGDIPRGPDVRHPDAPVPQWTETRRATIRDRIPTAQLSRNWALPGRLDDDAVLVDMALTILAGGSSSRLYNDLVRDRKLAVAVNGNVQAFEKVSMASLDATVTPGGDPAAVETRIDALLAAFLKDGPSADEVNRVATRNVAATIRGLEAVGGFGGKAVALAEGAVYAGDAGRWRKELAAYATATPATVLAAARRWLARGDFRLTALPGERPPAETVAPRVARAVAPAAPVAIVKRMPEPPVGRPPTLTLPPVERATLANGLKVELAQRTAVPLVRMTLSFDAGLGADSRDKPGTQALTRSLLDEGAAGRSGPAIAELRERLGANISAGTGTDRTRVSLDALKPNLDASLALFADIVQRPDFPAGEVETVRGQLLTAIAQEESDPTGITRRLLSPTIFGSGHPYGVPSTGTGTTAGVTAATRADLITWHRQWIRPDNATLFVVGDISMAELKPRLEAGFGNWQPDPTVARGTKNFPPVTPPAGARIVLIDRPGSPQSLIRGGVVLPVTGRDDPVALSLANDILGGLSTSRLNMDIREEKNWAYGVGSLLTDGAGPIASVIVAPVQTDRTGDALKAMIADVAALTSTRPIDAAERDKAVNNNALSLPGEFERGTTLLGAIERNAVLGRPDDYYTRLVPRLRAMTPAQLNEAARLLSTDRFTWFVVGDRKLVEPQLRALGLPLEVR